MKNEETKYNLAASILELLLIERKHEDERGMIITKKANVIMSTMLIYNAIMLSFVQFNKIGTINDKPLLALFYFCFGWGMGCMLLCIDYGHSILKPSDYVSPDIDYLTDERFITYPHEDVVKNEFIHHYKQVVIKNQEINNEKARLLNKMAIKYLLNIISITLAILIIA